MLFRKIKEMQSLIVSRTKALKKAESQIDNRNKFIYKQQEENRNLRLELKEEEDLIKRIESILNSNKYNNEKSTINIIKELVRDHQSKN